MSKIQGRRIRMTKKNDIKVFASNPELAAKALEVAELAEKKYADAGVKEP